MNPMINIFYSSGGGSGNSGSGSSGNSNIDDLKDQIDELEREIEELESKANECDAAAERLEEAKRELEEAIQALYEAINEEIAILEAFLEEIRHTDKARAMQLEGQLDRLRTYLNALTEIKESFSEAGSLTTSDILSLSSQFRNIAQATNILSTMHMNASERLCAIGEFFLGWQFNAIMNATAAGIQELMPSGGDPINISTGNFYYTEEDIGIPGRYPLSFARFYNAIGGLDTTLGANWTHNYNIRLFNNGEHVHIVFDDGHVETYTKMGEGLYVAPLDHTKTLTMISNEEGANRSIGSKNDAENIIDDGFYLTFQNMQRYRFCTNGALRCIEDTNGNKILLEYDAGDDDMSNSNDGILLTKVSSNSGSFSFSYNDDGRMSSVTDHAGRKVTFDYEQGQLIKVSQPTGAVFQYEYAVHNENPEQILISKVIDQNGVNVIDNSYDNKGRTIVQHMSDGGTMHLKYDDERLATIVTNQNGNKTTYFRDEKYRSVKILHSDCEELFEYDDNSNCTKYVDRNKNIRRYEYDVYGNMTSSTDPLDNTTTIEYNNHNKPTRITRPNGGVVSLNYDKYGNLTYAIDPLGQKTGLTYNDNGLATVLTMADLSQSKVEHDKRGNITAIIDSANVKTLYEYDDLNRVIKSINGEGASTLFEYNARGHISKVTDALGAIRSYEYDASGRVTRITDFDGGVMEYKHNCVGKIEEIKDQAGGITKIGYDLMWNIINVTNPNGDTVSYEYDHHNRVIMSVDEEGHTTEYKYDNNGNVITVIVPSSIATNSDDIAGLEDEEDRGSSERESITAVPILPLAATTHIKYDPLNRQKEITEPDGSTTTLEYDEVGNIIQITDALGNVTKREYDLAGQLTKFIDPLGNATTFTYTPLGKIEAITNAKGESKTHTYYSGGRLKSVSLPCGETETYEYNKNGNVVKVTDALGNATVLEYDCLDRVTQTTNPLGHSKKFAYDAIGNITQMTDENGNTTQYKYSPLGDIIEVIDATGHSTKYDYDNMRRLAKLTQYRLIDDVLVKANNGQQDSYLEEQITTYERNKKGEVIAITSPLGDIINYTYDGAGNLISKTDEDGLTTLYEYNLVGKLSKIGYADGKTVELSYNPLKHLTQMKDWLGITTIQTDPLGRATKITDHDNNEVSYAYNAIGQREHMVYPNGDKVGYEYNPSGRLAKVAHLPSSATVPSITSYIHDPMGRLSERVLPDGTSTKYEFNPLGAIASLAHSKDNQILDQFLYGYDSAGNIAQIEKHRRGIEADNGVFKYAYDPLNRLTSVVHNDDVRSYEYDGLGNRITSLIDGAKTQHTFNSRNQLIKTFEGENITDYTYDKRGNLIGTAVNGQLHQSFTFDAAGMMETAFTQGKGSAEYAYNGFRKRVGKLESLQAGIAENVHSSIMPNVSDPMQEVRYVLDLTRPYDDLLMTSSRNTVDIASEVTSQSYIWGNSLLSASSSGNNDFHYLQDHLGSTIRFTGLGNGDESLNSDEPCMFGMPMAYDEFGNAATATNMPSLPQPLASQPFGFTGYQTDNISGLNYAQARYYSPDIGRFTAEDPARDDLNWYGYCNSNPVKFVDPTGLFIAPIVRAALTRGESNKVNNSFTGNSLMFGGWPLGIGGSLARDLIYRWDLGTSLLDFWVRTRDGNGYRDVRFMPDPADPISVMTANGLVTHPNWIGLTIPVGNGEMVTVGGTILDVPVFNQRNTETAYTGIGDRNNLCWATSAAMVAAFFLGDEDDRTDEIARLANRSLAEGAGLPNLQREWPVFALRDLGIPGQRQDSGALSMEEIRETIGNGTPFGVLHGIVDSAGNWVGGHWTVVIGYIDIPGEKPRVVFNDPDARLGEETTRSMIFDDFHTRPSGATWTHTAQ